MSGLVCFEPGKIVHPVIAAVNQPCLIMSQQKSDSRIRVGVTNPDLGLLPADAPTPTFNFISQNENQYLPSQRRPVQVVLKGAWRLATPAKDARVISTVDQKTTIEFNGLHGMSVQAELVRAKSK
jgi:hypothetical protein